MDACLSPVCLCDIQQLCGRLMPQVCLLLVDKSQDVRDLALTVLNSCIAVVKAHHSEHKKSSTSSDDLTSPTFISPSTSSTSLQGSTANGQPNNSSGWTSWAVDGFSKSIERVALNATGAQSTAQPESGSAETPVVSVKPSAPKKTTDEWGDIDIDLEDDEDSQTNQMPSRAPATTRPSTQTKPPKAKSEKLTKPPKQNEFDDWDESAPPAPSKPSSKSLKTKEKAAQPTITKMAIVAHSDFDDWDNPPAHASAPVAVNQTKHKETVPKSVPKLADEFDEWGDDLGDLDISDLPAGSTWGDEDDLDLDLNVLGTSPEVLPTEKKKVTPAPSSTKPLPMATTVSSPPVTTATSTPTAPAKAKGNSIAKKEKDSSASAKKASKPATVVKKLAVSPDNWDDF
jgi:hypothetical protein